MLKITQAKLQQYVNQKLSDVQAGFRKGKERDQIANIHWIIEKAREFQEKNIYFCFTNYAKAFDWVSQYIVEHFSIDGNNILPYLPPEKSVFRSRSNS